MLFELSVVKLSFCRVLGGHFLCVVVVKCLKTSRSSIRESGKKADDDDVVMVSDDDRGSVRRFVC